MKIAAKISLALTAALALAGAAEAFAQVTATNEPLASPATASVEMPIPPAPVISTPAAPSAVQAASSATPVTTTTTTMIPAASSIVVPSPQPVAAPFSPSSLGGGDLMETRSHSVNKSSDPKVPDSVKGVISKLSSGSGESSLEDLNSAREAVAKLDVLIDIEKRLNDLTSLRQERNEKNSVPQISASAVLPKNVIPSNNSSIVSPPMLPVGSVPSMGSSFSPSGSSSYSGGSSKSNVDVERVYGTTGNYKALVKVSEGKAVVVKAGDKLTDGSTVKSITNRSVVLVQNGKERTVAVKNVETMSSGR